MRRLTAALFVVLAAFAGAQQGAAGYGQGGGGFGGGGGGMGGRMGGDLDEAQKARPDDEENPRLWTARTAILTPGDRVEFKFDAKKGETIFAGATSDAFDPALAMVDANGKELAKNDDRAEGDQAPFLAFRFPEAGTYTLRVLAYKSASGGKFTLRTRTFTSLDAVLGPATVEVAPSPGEENRAVFRIAAKKGTVYDLRSAQWVKPYLRPLPLLRIVGPTGVGPSDLETFPTPDGTPVFRAKADGDVYVEYVADEATTIRTDFHEVAVLTTTPKDAVAFDLQPGELKVVEFPVLPDAIVRTTLEGTSLLQQTSAPADPRRREMGGEDATVQNTPAWTAFLLNRSSQDDVVRIFHAKGTARVVVRSNDAKPQQATLRNAESLPTWAPGETKGTLGIGDIRLFLVTSTKSELMKVFAKAPAFQVRLDIYRLDGTVANTLMDRRTHTAGDDLYFPDPKTFVVRLTCDGYGGSGDYTLRRETLAPAPYALGTPQTLNLDGANFGLYAVELEAGKRYQLTTDRPNEFLRADLLDDDGQFLVSQAVGFDNVVVQYFVPTRSGRHRLWLRGAPGAHRFRFELHKPPTIGD